MLSHLIKDTNKHSCSLISLNRKLTLKKKTRKKASFEKNIKELKIDAGELAFEAEKKSNLTILRKSNRLKRAATDKESDLVEIKSTKAMLMELKE